MSNLKSLSLMAAMGAMAMSSFGEPIGYPTIFPTLRGAPASTKAGKRAGISMAQQQRNSRKTRNVKRHKAAARN